MARYGNKIREDKSVLTEPRCPFCKQLFESPAEVPTMLGFFTGGQCSCGAVYVHDPTKKDMGNAFMDALAYVCKEDWDLALSLTEDVDYMCAYLNYVPKTHTLSLKTQGRGPYEKNGNMLFIKLKD
ncbi:MAG: hypothetical protein HQK88_16100 [Nitrospirae bacterium]|nr:hypothetical protein [Nitrospirota bacterium]MBF0536401.1 hypothetical protein [Nitrospirota bacterium]MBF0618323.1 hypothetical protein [Nitrospirota bacterium]